MSFSGPQEALTWRVASFETQEVSIWRMTSSGPQEAST